MNLASAVAIAALFCAGILAGEELVIRFGIRGPLASLEQRPHILLRQGLIRRLMVLVPAIYFPTLLLGMATTLLRGLGPGFLLRGAAVVALLVWLVATLGGTAPINQAVRRWDPAAPPADWLDVIRRWERLDTVRAGAATAAFALFLLARRWQPDLHQRSVGPGGPTGLAARPPVRDPAWAHAGVPHQGSGPYCGWKLWSGS